MLNRMSLGEEGQSALSNQVEENAVALRLDRKGFRNPCATLLYTGLGTREYMCGVR